MSNFNGIPEAIKLSAKTGKLVANIRVLLRFLSSGWLAKVLWWKVYPLAWLSSIRWVSVCDLEVGGDECIRHGRNYTQGIRDYCWNKFSVGIKIATVRFVYISTIHKRNRRKGHSDGHNKRPMQQAFYRAQRIKPSTNPLIPCTNSDLNKILYAYKWKPVEDESLDMLRRQRQSISADKTKFIFAFL